MKTKASHYIGTVDIGNTVVVQNIRKILKNTQYRLWLRGRGSRPSKVTSSGYRFHPYQGYLPLSMSTKMALYLRCKNDDTPDSNVLLNNLVSISKQLLP